MWSFSIFQGQAWCGGTEIKVDFLRMGFFEGNKGLEDLSCKKVGPGLDTLQGPHVHCNKVVTGNKGIAGTSYFRIYEKSQPVQFHFILEKELVLGTGHRCAT